MITIYLMQKHYFPKSYFKENSCIENPCGAKHVGFPCEKTRVVHSCLTARQVQWDVERMVESAV